MKYTLSIYTHLFVRNQVHYLYNSETGLFCSIDKDLFENLYNGNFNAVDASNRKTLIEKKVIVEEKRKYDFYHTLRLGYFTNISVIDTLYLLIGPTVGCNFACPYCFEGEKKNKIISSRVIRQLTKFINSYRYVKSLHITWYGGEPLIAFNKIKEIVERIGQDCEAKIVSQSMVTNGYCITDEVISFMKENNFSNIQISLDGAEEKHNKTRFLKGSRQGTFLRIVSNLDRLMKEMPETFSVSLRVNISRDNEDDFAELYHYFKERYPQGNVYVYPGFIEAASNDGIRLCHNCFSFSGQYDFYKRMASKGVPIDFFPKRRGKGCDVYTNQNLIIGPSGELYKCWNDFNHPDKIIGNIGKDKITNPTLLGQYIFDSTIYNRIECKDCLVFPVCRGGCSWMQRNNLFNGTKYELCSYLKDTNKLEECLLSERPNCSNMKFILSAR